MLYQYIRVIKSDNGVLTDESLRNQEDDQTLAMNLVATEDYIYIGQHYAFNNFFLQVDTANTNASLLSIQYWDNREWRNAVDILDGTLANGITLAKSGVVQFSPDTRYSWAITSDTTNGIFPPELSTLNIYNVYWMRLKFSANLSATAKLKMIAYAFTRSQQISILDTTVNEYFNAFEVGKTNWDKEIIAASYLVVRDLRKKGLIQHQGNLLRLDEVSIPTDWKVLELIYRNLGGDYRQKLEDARKYYEETIQLERYTFDVDGDAFVRQNEIVNSPRTLVR